MKISRYSKNTILSAIDFAISKKEQQEIKFSEDYIRINPEDTDRRNLDKELVLYGLMMARIAIKEELQKAFKELEQVNSEQ